MNFLLTTGLMVLLTIDQKVIAKVAIDSFDSALLWDDGILALVSLFCVTFEGIL